MPHEKILCVPHEKIPLRTNRRQNLVSSRGPCMISRETVWTSRDLEIVFAWDCLISRDLENVFARDLITSRDLKSFFAQTVRFRAKSCDSNFIFLASILRLLGFFATNCSWFNIFVFSYFFWNNIAAICGDKAWHYGELLISCLILSRTHGFSSWAFLIGLHSY